MPPKYDPRDSDSCSEKSYNGKPTKKPQHQKQHQHQRSRSKPRGASLPGLMSAESLNNGMANMSLQGASRYAGGEVAAGAISSDKVQEILECPVCFEIPKAPIFNCETGHTVCGDCRSKVPNCPLCRRGFTSVRNFIAEKLAESLSFKCRFSPFGCEATLKGSEEESHVQLCNFRPVGCEVYPCHNGQIDYGDYLSHLKRIHRAVSSPGTQTKVTREVHVKKPNRLLEQGHRVPYIMSCFGNTFLQYSQAVGGKLWYWVSLFGTPEEAQRYKVTMSLVARNRDLKCSWTGPVHSVRHSGDDIYLNGLCMVTTEECLKAFFHRHNEGFPAYFLEIEIEKAR